MAEAVDVAPLPAAQIAPGAIEQRPGSGNVVVPPLLVGHLHGPAVLDTGQLLLCLGQIVPGGFGGLAGQFLAVARDLGGGPRAFLPIARDLGGGLGLLLPISCGLGLPTGLLRRVAVALGLFLENFGLALLARLDHAVRRPDRAADQCQQDQGRGHDATFVPANELPHPVAHARRPRFDDLIREEALDVAGQGVGRFVTASAVFLQRLHRDPVEFAAERL